MTRALLLNLSDDEERRAALLEDGRLSLLWVERADEGTLVGNVYKGRVTHVERAIGAAFVDIGLDRPGFLHGDDVPALGEDTAGPSDSPPIQDVLEAGQEIVVQVTRDALAHKGPSLTGHVSIPGRRVVLFPDLGRKAVSRKITDEAERKRLEDIVASVPGASALGVVVRTAGAGVPAEELKIELSELIAAYAKLVQEAETCRAPALLRADADFVARAVRELLGRTIQGPAGPARVVVDTEAGKASVEHLVLGAADAPQIELHAGPTPLFHAHGVEREVRALDDPRVPLPGGSSLVIHETEALWAIDVNSGRMRDADSLEETALAVDLVAAVEAARQIRLRDLGGLVVVDFIDCVDLGNRAKVEEKLREELAKDPARMRIAPLSEFMVAEITRRRMRSGPAHAGSATCPSCRGRGRTRLPRSAGLAALRELRAVLAGGAPHGVEIACSAAVADDLEARLPALRRLEETHDVPVHVDVDDSMAYDRFEVRKLQPSRRGKG